MVLEQFTGLVRRCVEDYEMIAPGDGVLVGVSGGKDSLALLAALAGLRRYYPKAFTLRAVTVDAGWPGVDFGPVAEFCEKLEVPYRVIPTEFARIVFEERKESNPCSLCAKMRRGVLSDAVKAEGCSKLALAHNFDDAVETFFMNQVFTGRLGCFEPVTYMDRSGVTVIRPMLYAGEGTVANLAAREGWPVVKNPCPMDRTSKRQETKELLRQLSKTYPDLKSKLFGAMQRLPLPGWEPKEHTRRPLP